MPGGYREGAGRKKGSPNQRRAEVAIKAAAEGITPIDYMLQIMRDEDAPQEMRLDAAKSAAPYVHARLSAVTVGGDKDNPVSFIPTNFVINLVRPDGNSEST